MDGILSKTCLGITAIVGVVILDAVALSQGIDGTLFATTMTLIGAIAGIGTTAKYYTDKIATAGKVKK